MKLILASRSAARRRLLEQAGVPFEARDAPLDEEAAKRTLRAEGADARALALGLAVRKALSVSANSRELVLGADQTLECDDGSMLDKPASYDDALAQLRGLSGTWHRLHAAAAIAQGGRIVWRHAASATLHVRPLGEAFLQDYLDREYETIRHNVGGYRIEGPGVQLFSRIDGSHFVIQGLPLLPLLGYLRRKGMLAN